MNSRENRILQECREYGMETEYPDDMYDYLTDAFGTTALNDGLYTPAEIEHATKVLGRLILLGGTE